MFDSFEETLLDFCCHTRFGRPVVTVIFAAAPGYPIYSYALDSDEERPVAFGFAHDPEHAETIYEVHTGQPVRINWRKEAA